MPIQYPDYDRSIAALARSVLLHFGVASGGATLPEADELLQKGFRNVVLVLLDGLGDELLAQSLPPESLLHRHRIAALSSVFPSTTAAAITSVETGMDPCTHGWLAWAMYFRELNAHIELFRNTLRYSGGVPAAPFHAARTYMPLSHVYDRIEAAGTAQATSVYPYGRTVTGSFAETCAVTQELCAQPGRHYVFAYSTEPDGTLHDYGCRAPQSVAAIERLTQQVESLCASLRDTLVLVTADHGLVDVEYRFLCEQPDLCAMLERPPMMESRVCSLFVKKEAHADFAERFRAHYGGQFLLLTREEVLAQQLFGHGPEHPTFRSRLGDFLSIAIDRYGLCLEPCAESATFRAAHAGLTPAEMTVPLIAIET